MHSCIFSSGCASVFRMVAGSQGEVFQSACDRGDSESCFLLGSLYYAGQGVAKDPARAFHLFQQSCTAGWSRGCSGIAECYRSGQGVAADTSLALENYNKACRAGIAPSCFSAASMYRALDNEHEAETKLHEGCAISTGNAESSAAYSEIGSQPKAASIPAVCSDAAR
jgi:TPR repeat protein